MKATATRKSPAGKATAKKTGARKVAAKKTVAGTAAPGSPVPAARGAAEPGTLAVLPGEDPWTPEEVAEARAELLGEVERLKAEIAASEAAVAGLLRDSGDSGGTTRPTPAPRTSPASTSWRSPPTPARCSPRPSTRCTGSTRARTGCARSCGKPIGKARMQAFPRATLCLDCKQRQERR